VRGSSLSYQTPLANLLVPFRFLSREKRRRGEEEKRRRGEAKWKKKEKIFPCL